MSARPAIAAVLFDIDGTLLDHEAAASGAVLAAIERERARHGFHEVGDEEALAEWWRLEALHYDTYLSGEIDVREQRRRRAEGMLEWLGSGGSRHETELEEWFDAFLTGYRDRWRAFDDVEPAIAELEARGMTLGAITNADGPLQRRKLEALGLLERLPAFVASSEAGAAKPDAAIFMAACELVGLPPARVAYVGDRLDVDARGARDAGLLGIWLDRSGEAGVEDPGVPVVGSLGGLGALLDAGAGAGATG